MRGRKPTPPERARRLGNPGNRPLPAPIEITVAAAVPDPPKHLLSTGRSLWEQVNRFASGWMHLDLDEALLLVACEVADDRARLKRVLAKEGHFQRIPIQNARGDVIGEQITIHPARRELRIQDRNLVSYLAMLGLTPTDRSRLKLTEALAENEFDKWQRAHSS